MAGRRSRADVPTAGQNGRSPPRTAGTLNGVVPSQPAKWRRSALAGGQAGAPAHVPKRLLQLGCRDEGGEQLRVAGFCPAFIPEPIERGDGFADQRAVGLTGISGDPFAIRVAVETGVLVGQQELAAFAVADEAGSKRHLEVEQIAREAPLQHEARVGSGFQRFRRRRHAWLVQAPACAIADVQRHFHVHDRADRRGGGPDVCQSRRLEAGEGMGPGELDEEQVVLDQKVPEGRLGQRATTERQDEVVLDVVLPGSAGIASQSAKQAVVEGQWSIGHGPVFADGGPLVTLSVDHGAQRGFGGALVAGSAGGCVYFKQPWARVQA